MPLDGAWPLRIESPRRSPPRVVSEGGWDLTWLLLLLGAAPRLSPVEPLVLSGLPAGVYTVTQGGASLTVPVGGRGGEGRFE